MASLFLSYAHRDMEQIDWLSRLTLYLAPVRSNQPVEIWDDRRIRPGDEWLREIEKALNRATAAILLVGPGFLASEFITRHEVPSLLGSASRRGLRIYPLIVGYAAYRRSALEPYQAFNDPAKPLEALPTPEQNRLLNELSQLVDEDLRQKTISAEAIPKPQSDLRDTVIKITRQLELTHTAFQAQARRRSQLYNAMRARLKIQENPQYEKFFFRYYSQMNEEEKFDFDQVRAITGVIYEGNQKIQTILDQYPELLQAIPELVALRQHLTLWLNKFERVFLTEPKMALVYTGVEDGVPFPEKIDSQIHRWLRAHP